MKPGPKYYKLVGNNPDITLHILNNLKNGLTEFMNKNMGDFITCILVYSYLDNALTEIKSCIRDINEDYPTVVCNSFGADPDIKPGALTQDDRGWQPR